MATQPSSLPDATTTYPVTVSSVVGTWAAMTLYGMLLILCGQTVHILQRRARQRTPVSPVLITAALFLFLFTSADIVLQCNHELNGLLYWTESPDKDLYFLNTGNWSQVAQDVIHYANFLIGDAAMLYRAWIVWDKRWSVVAFNALLWFAAVAGSVRAVQLQAALVADQTNLYLIINLVHWSIVVVAFSVVQTTIATGLIAYRIWKVDRASAMFKESSLRPVVHILVESGCLYTAFMVAVIVVLTLERVPLDFFSQIGSPITAIAFYLIIVRAGSQRNGSQYTTTAVIQPRGVTVNHEIAIQRLEEGEELSVIGGRDKLRMKEADNASASQLDA
ncbi:hypothetical protein CALVIDRAFT_595956 [Calocera viscosa TUFC12733]|uniref:Uncharacterized protein n=1 Tax=Calocera viscosa (strain TUFC12733) TaxID=1330018 RepID=A0A167Q2D6_CALVF|nr:hypothetical protein CALVIDRAFT_595956 [Calocera viscosa TUFC12733]